MKVRCYDEEYTVEGLQTAMLMAREECAQTKQSVDILGNDNGFVCRFSFSCGHVQQTFDADVSIAGVLRLVSVNQLDLPLDAEAEEANRIRTANL